MEKRKSIRLKNYDYSQAGYYFVTICTQDKKNVLWENVGAPIGRPPLNKIGIIIEEALYNIPKYYSNVLIDCSVIMPNHIHFILIINSGRPMGAPTVSGMINQFKGYVTKQIGYSIWQKLFYEHIIRNENELKEIREYIQNNPIKWEMDKYFCEP